MGDVAMTAPVLAELSRVYPTVEIVMLTRHFYEPFFDGISNLSIHNIDLADYHRGSDGLLRLYRELKEHHSDVEMIFDLNDKIYSKFLRVIWGKLSNTPYFWIDKGRSEKKSLTRQKNKVKVQLKTSIERYADVFRAAGFKLGPIPAELSLRKSERPLPLSLGYDKTDSDLWIGLAPFAQHKGKMYPLKKVYQLTDMILEQYPAARIFVFGGGPAERKEAEYIQSLHPENIVPVIGKFILREEMDIIAHLDLLISMDSSAMHMASLLGVPVVSIWGATHPFAGFLGLGQSMEDAVGIEALECRPCSVYGHKPCHRNGGDYACLYDLPPEDILQRVVHHLK